MHYSTELGDAQRAVEAAALRSIAADRFPRDDDRHAGATSELADERLALACRDLVRLVEALPEAWRPVGWDAQVPA